MNISLDIRRMEILYMVLSVTSSTGIVIWSKTTLMYLDGLQAHVLSKIDPLISQFSNLPLLTSLSICRIKIKCLLRKYLMIGALYVVTMTMKKRIKYCIVRSAISVYTRTATA